VHQQRPVGELFVTGAGTPASVQHQGELLAGGGGLKDAGAHGLRGQFPFLVQGRAETFVLLVAAWIDFEDRNGFRQCQYQPAGAALVIAKGEDQPVFVVRHRELIGLPGIRQSLDAVVGFALLEKCRLGEL
jgi:hypothetical protein